ncbi:hypothetical protein MTP99_005240 [Tenebrio molitor]|nr:hypothetical protein MTP99_005240 [Tenebrio molitor]
MKTRRRGVEDTIKKNTEECTLIGGDFNWRIGERGARRWEEERKDGKRKSKNKGKWKSKGGAKKGDNKNMG